MEWIAYLPFLIPFVAVLAGMHQQIAKDRANAAAQLGEATGDPCRALDEARADRDRLRTRIEALEAIVTDDGFDLERDARRVGLEPRLDADRSTARAHP